LTGPHSTDQNHKFIISDEEISFETRSESYCVCIVDIVDSTRITSRISDPKRKLYEQEWLEKDEHGVNFSYEGFMTEVNDNGLRRLKALSF